LKPVGVGQSTVIADLLANNEPGRKKNRYVNIKPYDISRVILLPVNADPGSDYINASWIPVGPTPINVTLLVHSNKYTITDSCNGATDLCYC